MKPLRHLINPQHPALQGLRLLADDEIIRADDATVCLSTLLSLNGDEWVTVAETEADDADDSPTARAPDSVIGKTVAYACSDEFGDMDRNERAYARKT